MMKKKVKVRDTSGDFSRMSFGVDFVPQETGVFALDTVLGGGYEKGDWIEVASASGLGKSTLVLNVCSKLVHQGKKVAYLDIEGGIKRKILTSMNLMDYVGNVAGECDFLLISPRNYVELEQVFDIIACGPPELRYDHIVIDSISAVQARCEDKSVTEDVIGLKARQMQNFLEKYKPCMRASQVTVWMINQIRTHFEKRGMTMVASQAPSGGNAPKHYPDIRIWMDDNDEGRNREMLKRLEKTPFGAEPRELVYGRKAYIKCLKNRNERPEVNVPMYVIFGIGISNVMTFSDLLILDGSVKMSSAGGWWTVEESFCIPEMAGAKGQTRVPLDKLVKKNLEAVRNYMINSGHMSISMGVVEKNNLVNPMYVGKDDVTGVSSQEVPIDPEDSDDAEDGSEEAGK